jgi:glycosyltransferase involved in cell wall biosynthesis
MLLDRTFPPDPRVANEARSLVDSGYEVHLLCLRHRRDIPRRESWQGVELHRLLIQRRFYRKASAVSLELPAYRLFLRGPLQRFLREERIDLLHVHDLPMVSLGLSAARRAGIPLIADLHENWPAALKTYGYAQRLPGKILISPERWQRHERKILPFADRIIVVVEEAKERLMRQGLDPHRIAVVKNTVKADEFEGFGLDQEILARFEGRLVVSYLGGFERHRGLEMVIDAVALLARRVPEALLLLVGRGSNESSLREQARRLGVAERVVFEGWQPFERFPSYVTASAICLIPHVRNEHTDTTIPHKLFHSMLLGCPVVTTDCRPLRRIVDETGCGLVVPSGDAEALAGAIVKLTDPELRRTMGEAGRRAVRDSYHWERDATTLRELYDRLASEASSGVRPRSES